MELRALLRNTQFALIFILLIVLTAVYLVGNVLMIPTGDRFNAVNSTISAVVAMVASGLFLRAWRVIDDPVSKRVWLGMAVGFGLWGLADIVLAVYSLVLGWELATPSIADLLWISAYPPLFYAVGARWRTLKLKPNNRQRRTISSVSVILLGLTAIFIVRPILADFDPRRLLEGIVNLFYPLADVVLIILVCHVLIMLHEGRYSTSWRLISMGIFLMTFSDLLYSYATWNNRYYPDGVVTPATFLTDTTYVLAYVTAAYGIWWYVFVWQKKQPLELSVEIAPAARYYALLVTNQADEIILASDNLHCLLSADPDETLMRRPLWAALGLPAEDLQPLLKQIRSEQIVRNVLMTVMTVDQRPRAAWLTAMAIYGPDNAYNGMNIALSADLDVPAERRLPASQEVVGILNYLVSLAGSLPEDECQVMRAYFLESIHLLATLLDQFGGSRYKDAMFEELARVIQQKGLPGEIKAGVLTLPDTMEGRDLAELLLTLLAAAQRFTIDLIGEKMVIEEFEALDEALPAASLHDLDKYRLRSLHISQA